MSDITERLEGCANYFRGTDADVPEWREASNVISRLRLELDMQQAMVIVPSQKDDHHTIEALRAENAELKKAGREVVDWWLRDGMDKFDGAPYAMFSLRAALGDE